MNITQWVIGSLDWHQTDCVVKLADRTDVVIKLCAWPPADESACKSPSELNVSLNKAFCTRMSVSQGQHESLEGEC